MQRIAFVTYAQHPKLMDDDAFALPHLQGLGIETVAAVWDDPAIRWQDFDAVILRSCWDYHHKPEAFRRWLDDLTAAGVKLWNPAAIVRWNMDKLYLRDLAERGVPIPRTVWIAAGQPLELTSVFLQQDFAQAVIKPAISATAFNTFQSSRKDALQDQVKLDAILEKSGALVQEFLPEIVSYGEWSLLFFEGQYSHAVLKRPMPGDFRVQNDFGGSYTPAVPPPQLIAQAVAILQTVDQPLLYARVDGVDRADRFVLIELELIEPALFLRAEASAPERFAQAIQARLRG